MLVGPPVPLLLSGFLLQAVFGILAGIGVWRGARSAPLVVEAVAAIAVALLIAVYVKRGLGVMRQHRDHQPAALSLR
jgi:hypothetical protein